MSKKYRKYKNFLEKFLDSTSGKRFFNIIYSLGAAIVIIGAMAKILHWSFGNEMLMIGMITEALVFLVSAFEKPDKEYKWEEVYPVLSDNENFIPKSERMENTLETQPIDNINSSPAIQSTSNPRSKEKLNNSSALITPNNTDKSSGSDSTTIILGQGNSRRQNLTDEAADSTNSMVSNVSSEKNTILNGHMSELSVDDIEQFSQMSDSMDKFAKATEALTKISESLQKSFSVIIENSDGIGNNTQNYITQMESLNRNIAGLNTIYEIQLKGVSGQINTIEHINAGLDRIKKLYDGSLVDSSIFKNETEKMAKQLSELNIVYSRLLQAMTTNMGVGGGFTPPNMGNAPTQP